MKLSSALFLFVFFFLSCGSTDQQSSSIYGLGFSENGDNLALLFGVPQNLPGVATDIRELNSTLLNPEFNFHFRTVTDADSNKRRILETTAREVKNINSLFWYYSGHGGGGQLDAGTGFLSFSEVAAAIKKARNNVPLDRLLVFIDACESGHLVNGNTTIIDENQSPKKDLIEQSVYAPLRQERDGKLYKQAFVMASSKKDEPSADMGEDYGGAFTYSLRESLIKIRKENPKATLKQLADMTVKRTIEESRIDQETGEPTERSHTPQYDAFPVKDVQNDLVFIYRK